MAEDVEIFLPGETLAAARLQSVREDWVAYTPVLAGTGWTIGNATRTGRYTVSGDLVHVEGKITFGSSTTFGAGAINITFPLTADTSFTPLGWVLLSDASGSTYAGVLNLLTSTTFSVNALNASGTYLILSGVTSTVPHTWDDPDVIHFAFTYRAA